MMLRRIVTSGVAVLVLAPAAAHAATFEVNMTSDELDPSPDGVCDTDVGTPGRQCSLRAALTEANDRPNADRIEFAGFDGNVVDDTIELTLGPLGVAEEVTIDGGICGPAAFRQPCVGVDAPDNSAGIVVGTDDVALRGLAVHGAAPAGGPGSGLRAFGAKRLMVRGSWFGLRLNGFAEPNGNNIALEVGADESDTDAARIGGKSARDANVFAGGDNGVVIAGGDRNRILGNLFSVNSLGTPLPSMGSPVGIFGHGPDPAVGNRIGIRVSRAAARSPECDGGCNAIARGEQSGIALFAGGAIPPRKTKIQGNFIGLEPDGESPLQNEMAGVNLGEADGTTIGGSGGARNVITGGELAVMQQPGSRGLELRSNLIGFDSSGQAPLDPPDGDTGGGSADFATRLESAAEAPTVVSGNRFAFAPDTTALAMFGEGAVVTRNVFGLRRNGGGLPAQPETQAILVAGKRCVIGRPGAGNVIGNTSFSGREAIEVLGGSGVFEGDRNVIEGNRIGVDSDGDAHPITGGGIGLITTANRNRIGGTSAAAENLISNVSENPIELLSVSDPMSTRAPTGNRILRNRGAGNGTTANDLFVNLDGLDGFGNGVPELQGGIEAPVIEEATRTRIEGSGAEPGADVWIYRTRDPAGASPANLRGFVAKTTATGAGEWAERFDRIAAADNLTALQEGEEGSSELALAVAP